MVINSETALALMALLGVMYAAGFGAAWNYIRKQRPGITAEISTGDKALLERLKQIERNAEDRLLYIRQQVDKAVEEQRGQGTSIVKLEEKAIYTDLRLEQMHETVNQTGKDVRAIMTAFSVKPNGNGNGS